MRLHLPKKLLAALATAFLTTAAATLATGSAAYGVEDITGSTPINKASSGTYSGFNVSSGATLAINNGSGGADNRPAGSTVALGTTTIAAGGKLSLWSWTQSITTYSSTDKVTIAGDITLNGNASTAATLYMQDGSYNFSGDITVVNKGVIEANYAKGNIINSLKGDSSADLTFQRNSNDTVAGLFYLAGANEYAGTITLLNKTTGNVPNAWNNLVIGHADALKNAAVDLGTATTAEGNVRNALELNVASAWVRALSGAGTVRLRSATTAVSGAAALTSATLSITGKDNGVFSGTVAENITLTIEENAKQTFSGACVSTNAAVINNGTLTVSGHLANEGTLTNNGTLTVSGHLANEGTLTNNGTLTVSGHLVNEGTLSNNKSLIISGTYIGTTINQASDAELTFKFGSVVDVSGMTYNPNNNTDRNDSVSGVQSYSGTYTIATTVGTITDEGVAFKVSGEKFTSGRYDEDSRTYYVSETRYNIASTDTKTMSDVQQGVGNETEYYINILGSLTGVTKDNLTHGIRGTGSIQVDASTSLSYEKLDDKGAAFTGSISVLGNLTGVSNSTLRHTIDGSGVVQVDTNDTLSYSTFTAKKASTFTGSINVLGTLTGIRKDTNNHSITGNGRVTITGELGYDSDNTNSFLNSFVGVVEVADGGDLRLGSTNNRLSNANKIVVTEGGIINFWTGDEGNAKVGTTAALELAGGTLGTSGGNLQYNGEIIVTASSYMGVKDKTLTLKKTVKAENGVITTNGTVKHTGGFDLSGNGNDVYTGTLLIESGSFESAGNMLGTSNEQHKTTIQMKEGKSFKKGDFTFTGKSNTDSIITFGKTGTFGVGDAHTVDNTSVTYAGSADATDATILGMNLGNGSTLTVTSGKLKVSGTNKLASINLNGGETTLTGSTEVTGTTHGGVVNGVVAANDDITLTVSGILKHNDFKYEGSKLSGLSNGLSMWNDNGSGNVSVTGGTVEQIGGTGKDVYAALKDVKLINALGKETRLYAGAELSGASIGGTLRVGRDDLTWNPDTQQNDIRVLKEVTVTVSGQADVTGEVKIETGSTFELTGQDTTSSIAKLTGSGTLKTTGDETSVTNASRFSGTLEATGGSLTANGTTTGDSGDVILGSLSGLKATGGSIVLEEVAPTLTITDLVVAGNGSISGAESYTANKVSIGAGEAGSLVGNLSIQDGGTITLDASAGATTETGGTKGLLLSALTTFADEGTTTTTGSLTLGSGLTLNLANLGRLAIGDSLTLFSGVTSAVYGDNATELTADGIEANTVFSNLTAGDFKLSYSNNIVALVAQRDTPEPTTATLSLLALMALAARRRRKA